MIGELAKEKDSLSLSVAATAATSGEQHQHPPRRKNKVSQSAIKFNGIRPSRKECVSHSLDMKVIDIHIPFLPPHS